MTYVRLDAKYVMDRCNETIETLEVALKQRETEEIDKIIRAWKPWFFIKNVRPTIEEARRKLHKQDAWTKFKTYQSVSMYYQGEISELRKVAEVAFKHGDGFVNVSTNQRFFFDTP